MLERPHSRRRAAPRKQRDQRHRQRRKRGVRCYTIEGDAALLDLLIRARWISEELLTDKKAVEAAITAMLAASART